jgi:hypothetical protein
MIDAETVPCCHVTGKLCSKHQGAQLSMSYGDKRLKDRDVEE